MVETMGLIETMLVLKSLGWIETMGLIETMLVLK